MGLLACGGGRSVVTAGVPGERLANGAAPRFAVPAHRARRGEAFRMRATSADTAAGAGLSGHPESRPVLFVIDDDRLVTQTLRDDLGRRFGQDFRVIGESSAAAGLARLREMSGRREPVALLIADHRMSEMTGVDFLARAHHLHPLAKRVLLVERDYSACSPVVQAMTLGQADYHLTKPWILEHD